MSPSTLMAAIQSRSSTFTPSSPTETHASASSPEVGVGFNAVARDDVRFRVQAADRRAGDGR